jgi:FkbM family methyltransferase
MNRADLESLSRDACRSTYLGNNTAICRILQNLLLYVDTTDVSLTPHMLMNGYWESWVTLAMLRHVRPGMVVADVGANIGYFAMALGRAIGPKGHLHVVEPNLRMVELMQKSIDVNGFRGRTTMHVFAAGAEATSATLWIPRHHAGNASLVEVAQIDGEKVSPSGVAVRPLDLLIQGRLDFLKVDIEGFEPECWKGMRSLWEGNPQMVVLMEYAAGFYDPPDRLPKLIAESGAKIQCVNTDGMVVPFDIERAAGGDPAELHMLWITHG